MIVLSLLDRAGQCGTTHNRQHVQINTSNYDDDDDDGHDDQDVWRGRKREHQQAWRAYAIENDNNDDHADHGDAEVQYENADRNDNENCNEDDKYNDDVWSKWAQW